MGRSQRHLREFQGFDSAGSAGVVALTIASPTAGANASPVTLTATAFNDQGVDISSSVVWSSDVDGALGGNGSSELTAGEHTLTASVAGASATVAVTI